MSARRPNYFLALVATTAAIGLPTALTAIAMVACAPSQPAASPAQVAVPHGSATMDAMIQSLGMPNDCPEQDPAQPNCAVPK